MLGEQGDAPLVVVEPGRAGDDLQHAAGEVATRGAVLVHQLLALVVGQGEPVLLGDRAASTSGRSTTPACPRAGAAGAAGPRASASGTPWAYSLSSVSDT